MPATPNIVLFQTDDHAPWTLPCHGNTEVRAPVFDRMAREGVHFRNAFTPTPVCSPARACLVTGLTSSQHGVHDFINVNVPECADRDWLAGQTILSEMLLEAGYRCGLSGKWHVGRCDTTLRGYDWYFDALKGRHLGRQDCLLNGEQIILEGNRTEIITDYAIDFLKSSQEDQPFYLQVGYIATHSPYTGQDPDLVETYREATFRDVEIAPQHPLSWNEGFAEDVEFTPEEARERHMNQYAAVTDIDTNIGRILDTLEAQGRMENTVVIYTSDHGLSLGQHGFFGKGNGTRPLNMYDISIRVPLLLYSPLLGNGIQVDRCTDHFDTFQTVCELCGIKPEDHRPDIQYPGRSYLPLAMGQDNEDWDDARFGEYGDLRMIRTPDYKLIRRYKGGSDELFDLSKDPGEAVNVIDQPDLQETRESLLVRLEDFYSKYEDPEKSGLRIQELPQHNTPQKPSQTISSEAWRDGIREARGFH